MNKLADVVYETGVPKGYKFVVEKTKQGNVSMRLVRKSSEKSLERFLKFVDNMG